MSKARPSLRDLALAEKRKPGNPHNFTNWVNSLDDAMRAEVLELLNDHSIDGASVYRVLKRHCGYPYTDSCIGKWRRGEYVAA